MEQTLEQFKTALKNKKGSLSRVRNSWGVYDYYKFYRKNRPKEHKYALNESQYFAIIRRVNTLLAEQLLIDGELEFPYRMGKLIVREKKPRTTIKDGKIKTSRRIDWDKTLSLWYNDPNEYKEKNLVYSDNEKITVLFYDKRGAIFKNKQYYQFDLNRFIYKEISKAVNSGTLELQSVFSRSEFGNIKGLYND